MSSTTTTVSTTTLNESSATVTQYGFFIDASRCNGCHACAVSCKSWLEIPAGPLKPMKVHEWETGSYLNLQLHLLPMHCFHCENPLCIPAAPGLIYKEPTFGAVLLDTTRATESILRVAADACPYGSITFASDDLEAQATKCNMCIDRLVQGLKPVCVMVCHNRALDFDTLANLQAKYGKVASIEGLPDPTQTTPSVVFKAYPSTQPTYVPYDTTAALQLLNQRGSLPPTYTNPSDVTTVPAGIVGRSQLVLKPNGVNDPTDSSVHDEG